MIAEKCKRKIPKSGGIWDGMDATWHATKNGRVTLCGHRIGSGDDGWFLYPDISDKEVSCAHCLNKLAKRNSRW
jgi:hypothetical protein